ncbi:hypothetical protein EXIGLDRAFT_733629 [Exidia glandulosa HHB12029]|uniref:Uncharacterized protein n=1 Tax=Exidia glandulosa HHB12029 TaxID=1314781 RepID=A0A165KFU4_EXIGL|nr:hypothetical protein EXIGLDRAFT_733629 [Exidia glandulosa HHB12029]
MTAAWLSALDISRLRRVVMEVSTPAEIISPYFRSMRGPIELSLQVLRFPQKLSVYRKHGLVFLAAAPQVDKSFQAPWGQLKMEPHALAEYCALMPRVTRLEFPTAAWADMARLAAPSAMLALTTLILDVRRGRLPGDYVPFVHGPSAVVRQIACPNLEQLVLVGHRKVRLRTAAIAHFMRARLGIAERARPTILLKTSGISLRGPALRLRRLVRKIIAT